MKKILMGLVLSLMMAANIFAVDLVKVHTFKTEGLGTIDVYFDYDATEPFDIKNESIEYFLSLQDLYEDVEVYLGNMEDWWPWFCSGAIENNCYHILMKSRRDSCAETFINKDGTVTVYIYVPKNQTKE